MHVVVTEYQPEWGTYVSGGGPKIRKILGANLSAIHHIGSTAVPGLAAKPVIDIMPVVKDLTQVDDCAPAFEAAGYECMGEFGIPGRRYFRKGGDFRTTKFTFSSRTTTGISCGTSRSGEYLRAHPEAAKEYGALKIRIAKQYPEDIEGYCDAKDAFVKALELAAVEWYSTRWQ